jgi:hypothetical protein
MSLRDRTLRLAQENAELRPYLMPMLMDRTAALPSATVKMFLMVLSSKLTRYDQKLQIREPNPYRLALLFEALQKVEKATKAIEDNNDPKSLGILKSYIRREFNEVPPVTNTIKQIDAFLTSGKLPTLT